ncbi:hypothetical protein NLC35_02765, partial [Candidatus Aminicenantes bacterium AC-334-K16]|nr:hypothetical protein [Candidatus Aminicenantes bacterium AC-334-K16]
LPAKENNFGLGVILGEPTGLSFKYWTGPQTALAGALAWSFEHESSFHLHLDYLVHNFHLWQVEQQKIPVYYGIGFRFKSAPGHDRFGVRIPLGISYFLPKVPLEIFFELVPVFDLSPKTDLFFNGGVGIRYYF